jgi:hypothetical protein
MFSHHITAPTATPMRIPLRRGVIGLTEREGLSARTQSADVEHAARSPSFFVIRETLRNSGIEQQELTQGFFVPKRSMSELRIVSFRGFSGRHKWQAHQSKNECESVHESLPTIRRSIASGPEGSLPVFSPSKEHDVFFVRLSLNTVLPGLDSTRQTLPPCSSAIR